jgi:D-sedoheptulose 7-phosphate isomerase
MAELAVSVSVAARRLADAIWHAYQSGRFVFLCGNGGSGANASHFCEDLGKGMLPEAWLDRDECRRLKVISLTDNVPYILAWANDTGYERIFVEQLKNLASAGDLLIAISGSGNSENVVRAVEWAKRHGLSTFGVVGYDGGRLMRLADESLHVPSHDMGMVEAVHGAVFHWVVDELRARLQRAGE